MRKPQHIFSKLMKNLVFTILKILVSTVILVYVLYSIPLSKIVEPLSSAKIGYILTALLIIMPVIFYLSAIQMEVLTKKQRLPIKRIAIMQINIVTGFYNLFLPGFLSGGAIKWYKLSSTVGKPTKALTSIVYNRLFNTLTTVFIGLLFWTLDVKARSNYFIGGTLLILFLGFLSLYFLAFNRRMFQFSDLILKRSSFIPEFIKNKLAKLFEAANEFSDLSMQNLLYILFLSFVGHALGIVVFYLFAVSIDIDISFINLGWIRSILVLLLMLPISFSGIGVREGSLVVILNNYSVLPEKAVALSLLLLARTVFFGLIGGVIEAIQIFFSKKQI